MSRTDPNAGRIATLDLLRLVAALAVVAYHYLFRGAAGDPLMPVAYPEVAGIAIYGYLGVNLFFLISGYVISWSAEGRSWQDFAVARFTRLYPAFLVCMTITFAVLLAAGNVAFPVTFAQFLANIFMFSPALGQPFVDGVYWSIVLELVFYFWVMLAVATGVFDRYRLGLIAGMLLVAAINETFLGSGALRMAFVTEFAPWFALGMLVQFVQSRGLSNEAALILAAALALSFAHMPLTRDWMETHYGFALSNAELIAANIAIVAIFVIALSVSGAVRATATTFAIGGLTYPLYLLHQNIGYLAIGALAPSAGRWLAVLAVTAAMIALSWAVWRYVETPLRRTLATRLTAAIARVTAKISRRRRSPSLLSLASK